MGKTELPEKLDKKEEAAEVYEQALVIVRKKVAETWKGKEVLQHKMGQTYYHLGKYAETAIEFQKAINRNPGMNEAREGLAMATFPKSLTRFLPANNQF